MLLLFELSKEHTTLPVSEIKGCLQAENITYKIIEVNNDVFIIDAKISLDKIKNVGKRLSFTFFIDELLFLCSGSLEEIKNISAKHPVESKGSIAIHIKNRSENIDSQPILEILGQHYTKNRRVDLENPDIAIRVVLTDTAVYVGKKIYKINRTAFEQRKVQDRPFFSPISLHPKLARAIVNISSVQAGQTLLDPFCGTGGILLEAAFIGVSVLGSDIEEKMIVGCTKTFDFFNIKDVALYQCDVSSISRYIKKVDVVVTDFPYGKSTTTCGERITDLYDRAFKSISEILKKNGIAVVGLANEDMMVLGEKYLSLIDQHNFRVHRSLTRYFGVFRK